MFKNKYIIILLFLLILDKCTPDKLIRKGNSYNTSHSSNDLSFYWPSNVHENDYEDLYLTDNNDKNFYDEYSSKANTNSRSSVIYNNDPEYNKQNRNSQDTWNKDKNQKKYIKTEQPKNKEKNPKEKDRPKFKIYRVQKGDNLSKISKKFGMPPNEIMKTNKIKNSNKIFEGMAIKISSNKIINKSDTGYDSPGSDQKNPHFNWPIKNIYGTERDGLDGVKSIGILITGKPRTAVLSSADGVVTKVGRMRGFGNYVILKHINNYLTIYSNLKEIKVNEGGRIKCGESIGRLEGNKLHFQIGRSGRPEDPFLYLSKKS